CLVELALGGRARHTPLGRVHGGRVVAVVGELQPRLCRFGGDRHGEVGNGGFGKVEVRAVGFYLVRAAPDQVGQDGGGRGVGQFPLSDRGKVSARVVVQFGGERWPVDAGPHGDGHQRVARRGRDVQ